MGWFIAQSLVFILVAFAIGLLVGWLIWGRRSDRSKSVDEESATVATPAADSDVDTAGAEAAAVPAPRADSESSVVSEPEVEAEVGAPVEAPEADAEIAAIPVPRAESENAAVSEVEPEQEPEPEPEPEPQDLKRIEGIGPKIDAALKAQGYPTYASVAAATEDELRAAIKAEGVRFAPSASSWARQAQFLAEGDEDGLKEYQDYLVGGQDRGVKFHDEVDYADVDEITDTEDKAEALAEDAAEVAAVEAAEGDTTEAKA